MIKVIGKTFDNSAKETPEALEWFKRNTYLVDDVLYWAPHNSNGRKRSAVYSNKPCGCVSVRGYIQVRMGRDKFMAHRIIWAIRNGNWPIGGIDHVNGNKLDNSAGNLRDTTQFDNSKNAAKYPRTEDWIATGVYRYGDRFRAFAQVNHKSIYLGTFRCHAMAAIKRRLFDQSNGFTQRHGVAS